VCCVFGSVSISVRGHRSGSGRATRPRVPVAQPPPRHGVLRLCHTLADPAEQEACKRPLPPAEAGRDSLPHAQVDMWATSEHRMGAGRRSAAPPCLAGGHGPAPLRHAVPLVTAAHRATPMTQDNLMSHLPTRAVACDVTRRLTLRGVPQRKARAAYVCLPACCPCARER
jgi:hypothetical protein